MVVVGIDSGGTFTDAVVWDGEHYRSTKVPSTPANPANAVWSATATVGGDLCYVMVHGTTVATNAILTCGGAKTAFVTTRGFRDMLHIGRQTRRTLYDLAPDQTPAVVDAASCFEVAERTDYTGTIRAAPDAGELERLVRQVRRSRCNAVAICLLHAYANPANEAAVKATLARALPDLYITASHEVAPEFREYERASTTSLNAYVGPMMRDYLGELDEFDLIGPSRRLLRVMHSNGGVMSPHDASKRPVTTVLSGPAAGAMMAAAVGRMSGFPKLITFDMGGTSTDVALVDGTASVRQAGEIAGMPIRIPMLDIHTVGAGGGSIAWVDEAGALNVGPQSAGADPGPASWSGGESFTVTDANLLLDRLPPLHYAGPRPLLDVWATNAGKPLATRLNIPLRGLSDAVVRTVNANMARAIRHVSVARGCNPAEFALLAFGGSGPLHACSLAELVGCPVVIIPPRPGVLSAMGLVHADVTAESVLGVGLGLSKSDLEIQFRLAKRAACERAREAGASVKSLITERFADVRLEGQSHELTVPVKTTRNIDRVFLNEYSRKFGCPLSDLAGAKTEVTAVRVRATSAVAEPSKLTTDHLVPDVGNPSAVFHASREAVHRWLVDRADLATGDIVEGLCVITQMDCAGFVNPGWRGEVDRFQNLILRRTAS